MFARIYTWDEVRSYRLNVGNYSRLDLKKKTITTRPTTVGRIHIINSGERICILFFKETIVVTIIMIVSVVL